MNKRASPFGLGVMALDLLTILLVCMVTLFITELLRLKGLNQPVAFTLVVTWPYTSEVDVDTYLAGPSRVVSYYAKREAGFINMSSDDDRGLSTDKVVDEDGYEIVRYANQEEFSIRQVVPGKYIVTLRMYAGSEPVEAKVSLYDNRSGDSIKMHERTVSLDMPGDEATAFSFRLGLSGMAENYDYTYVPISDMGVL